MLILETDFITPDGAVRIIDRMPPQSPAQHVMRIGKHRLALGEVDLDLIEPDGMIGTIHGNQPREFPLESSDAARTEMRGAIVHDPDHPAESLTPNDFASLAVQQRRLAFQTHRSDCATLLSGRAPR